MTSLSILITYFFSVLSLLCSSASTTTPLIDCSYSLATAIIRRTSVVCGNFISWSDCLTASIGYSAICASCRTISDALEFSLSKKSLFFQHSVTPSPSGSLPPNLSWYWLHSNSSECSLELYELISEFNVPRLRRKISNFSLRLKMFDFSLFFNPSAY